MQQVHLDSYRAWYQSAPDEGARLACLNHMIANAGFDNEVISFVTGKEYPSWPSQQTSSKP